MLKSVNLVSVKVFNFHFVALPKLIKFATLKNNLTFLSYLNETLVVIVIATLL